MPLLTGSTNCIKYVLLTFNLVFMLTGIVLIAVGAGVSTVFSEYELFLVNKFFSVPTFLIVIGSFIIIISFFGCFGALRENYCLVLTFSILLTLIFILELAAGISGYVLRSDAEELIKGELLNGVENYNPTNPNKITSLWDSTQREFECCGVTSFADWEKRFNDSLPLSCCRLPDGVIGSFSCTTKNEDPNRYSSPCLTKFATYISAHAVSLGIAGIVLAFVQFFGVLFSCYIAREIKIRNGGTGFP